MEQVIEKNRAGVRNCLWIVVALAIAEVYTIMCLSISVIVPCTIVNSKQATSSKNGQIEFTGTVTVRYRDDSATVDFYNVHNVADPADYYSVGTQLACSIYPYRYNAIGMVFLQHYNYDIEEETNYLVKSNDAIYIVAIVLLNIGLAAICFCHDCWFDSNLRDLHKNYPDQCMTGQKANELKLLTIAFTAALLVYIYTSANAFVHRNEPCVITRYEEVLHDYTGSGTHDNGHFVKVRLDVQVVTPGLYVGTMHVRIYDGSYNNISAIRDYYRAGQTLTCDIHPTRFSIIDSVSKSHYAEKDKELVMVQPSIDKVFINIMFSTVAAYVMATVLYKMYNVYKLPEPQRQPADELQPLKEPTDTDTTYKEPTVLNSSV